MAGRRKAPKLREKTVKGNTYHVADIWKPDGKRTTINFGPADESDPGAVYEAFGRWLRLYQSNSHKTLTFKSPWDAIQQMVDPGSIVSVGDLARQYIAWAEGEFKFTRNGDVNPNYQRLELVLKFVEPYHDWPVQNFGPDELKAIQKSLTEYRYRRGSTPEQQLTRYSINEHMKQFRRMFAWAVGRRIVDPGQEQSLKEVKPLRFGAKGTTEKPKRRPVTPDEFWAVVESVNIEVADMLRVMWFSVIRPTEVCLMRPYDFLRQKDVWLYVPGRDKTPLGDHKTVGHQRARAIPITAKLQKVLKPRIEAKTNPMDYIFSPKVATQFNIEKRFAERDTPLSCGNRPGTNRVDHPMIEPGDHYTSGSFRAAVIRGCKRVDVERFSPYDLRRTTATRVDALLGKDAAQSLLGHADRRTTDVYMLEEVQRAIQAALELDARLN